MIYDSGIWKQDLQNEIESISVFFDETDLDYDEDFEEDPTREERDMMNIAFIKLQKFVIYSSIIVRKLIESHKISDEFMSLNFPLKTFKKFDQTKVNFLNGYEIETLYDLDKGFTKSISLKALTDILIHSFHFMPKYDWQKIDDELPDEDYENFYNNGLLGFYLSSDKTKSKELSYLPFLKYIEILNDVINDRIIYIERNFEDEIIVKSIYNRF